MSVSYACVFLSGYCKMTESHDIDAILHCSSQKCNHETQSMYHYILTIYNNLGDNTYVTCNAGE